MKIRKFNKSSDYDSLRQFAIELQDFERRLDPRMPSGESICDEYLDNMFEECKTYSGQILMAEIDRQVGGYITVLCRYVSEDVDDGPREYGYITDVYVTERYRGKGIGMALLKQVESLLIKEDISELMIGVLASNTAARSLYQMAGFNEFALTLEKKL